MLPEMLIATHLLILALEECRAGGFALHIRMLLDGRLRTGDDGVEEGSSLFHVIRSLVQHLGSRWPLDSLSRASTIVQQLFDRMSVAGLE